MIHVTVCSERNKVIGGWVNVYVAVFLEQQIGENSQRMCDEAMKEEQ